MINYKPQQVNQHEIVSNYQSRDYILPNMVDDSMNDTTKEKQAASLD